MGFFSAIPIVGKIIDTVTHTIDKAVTDKDLKNKLQTEIVLTLSQLDYAEIEKEIEAKARIITAEAQGHSWLQRNWRPILMLVFVFIIAWNYAIVPIFSCFFTKLKPAVIPPDMWQLLKLGVGGYIVGRSGEKIVSMLKGVQKG
jgi:hypothetical protein